MKEEDCVRSTAVEMQSYLLNKELSNNVELKSFKMNKVLKFKRTFHQCRQAQTIKVDNFEMFNSLKDIIFMQSPSRGSQRMEKIQLSNKIAGIKSKTTSTHIPPASSTQSHRRQLSVANLLTPRQQKGESYFQKVERD